MIKKILVCRKCNLCKNQLPLIDNSLKCDIMMVGLSAKKVNDVNKSIPLQNDTNSGKLIEQIENSIPEYKFYRTNLVKCLPLDNGKKIRYPNIDEMNKCIDNLLLEITYFKPKIIFLLGRKTYGFVKNYINRNKIEIDSAIVYIEHPSYIYIYKRKYINDYINKVKSLIKDFY